MKHTLFFLVLSSLGALNLQGQSNTYFSGSLEFPFSFATIDDNGDEESSLMRFAPFFNIQSFFNADMSEKFGLFTGLAIRNVGYIYDQYQSPADSVSYKKKFRTFNLGLPVGIKVGNFDKFFVYGGYEIEFPFHYKEKTFDDGDKIDKITGWFSNRSENFQHGFFVGMQMPYGGNFKFKYYLNEFHNQDFTTSSGAKPYAGLESNVWYVSISFFPFVNWKEWEDADWD